MFLLSRMVRHRKKKKPEPPSEDEMKRAVCLIIDHDQSIRQTSKETGIPKSTLARYVSKAKSSGRENVRFSPFYATARVFSDAGEAELEDYLLTAFKHHHGLTTKACRDLAFQYVVKNNKATPVSWETNRQAGPWGSCEHSSCGFGGMRSRTVWCSHRSGWTTLFSHCHYLPIPPDSQSCFKVCDGHRDQVTWVPSQWTKCQRANGEGQCVRLGGTQSRQVPCVHVESQSVLDDEICLYFQPKPPEERTCELRCPQDCVLSPFSTWSLCDECFHLYSRRMRRVLVAPVNGGKPCPPLVESRPCENCTDTYRFNVGKWSPCERTFQFKNPKKKERSHLLIGYQNRDILCVNSVGKTVGHRYCLDSLHLPGLRNMQACPLPQDCLVSDWMEWRSMNSSCLAEGGTIIPGYMSRIRRVRQMPRGIGKPCPPLTDTFQVIGAASTLSSCPRYKWVTSDWSECEMLYQSLKRAEQCGPGIHIRVAYCVRFQDGKQVVVDSSHCETSQPVVSRQCHIPCTQNCTVSHWSDWTECAPDVCPSSQRKASYRFRYRRVLQPQGGFGLPCPYLSESQPCTPEACFTWNITEVGPCIPWGGSRPCGRGTQKISVTCQDKWGETVHDDQCLIYTRVHKQSSSTACYHPCPEDCIVSDWTVWSPCPHKCDKKGSPAVRRRTRVIYAKADKGGKACPREDELSEVEICPLPSSCHTYIWQTSDWGSCVITKRSVTCGTGMRSRSVQCYRVNGAVMPDGSFGGLIWVPSSDAMERFDVRCSPDAKPSESEQCSVPCPVDCDITDWSDWSACSATCQEVGSSGFSMPSQMRQRYVIEEASGGGIPCPTRLVETRLCGPLPFCTYYYWAVSEWSQCVLPPYYIYCGQGLKARSVSCRDEGGNKTYPDFCLRSVGPMPAATETCFVMCDQDCKLSGWSAFGQCVNGCNGFRIRTRNLVDDSKLKEVCRNQMKYPLVEKEVCHCSEFKPIQVGDWSPCILEDTASDQVLGVTSAPGEKKYKPYVSEEKSNEIAADDFLKDLSRFEITTAGPTDMNVLETEPVRELDWEKRVTGSPDATALGDVPGRPVVSRRRLCGMGTKYRLYICQSQIQPGVIEPAHNCSSRVYSEEVCIVPCPEDCEMTDWTPWTPCSVSCGYGIQTRERRILKAAQAGGQACPHLENGREVENQTCHSICSTNTWRTANWSQCFAQGSTGLNKEILCGLGVRTRLVECVKKADFHGSQKDSEFFCRSEPRPIGRQICEMPCPGQCVVSDWSSWSECPRPCSQSDFRKRNRQVLRTPADEKDVCPVLSEEEPCMQGHNCFEFSWQVSPWSSCILEDRNNDCGIGWKRRFALCRMSNGTRVESIKCEKLYGPMIVKDVEACNKTCHVNCAVSEWSPWSGCSQTCGQGTFTRKRSVLFPPVGRGRQCPEAVEQSKPCFVRSCYSIVLSEWTKCQLKKGACGHGIENRTVSCVSKEGLAVDIEHCADQAINLSTIQTKRPCSIPCPGECQILEWSDWSQCYIGCEDFHQGDRAGIQSRSRVVLIPLKSTHLSCPSAWEYRGCMADQCFSFFWRTSDWSNGYREVWCSRNDGLNVTGGCDEDLRPSEILSCLPLCSANHSFCVDTNLCGCHRPYSAIYDNKPIPTLLECVMAGVNGTNPSAAPALYYPLDGPTNFWMYAVLAAGTLFIVFVIVALYTIWHRERKQKANNEPSVVSTSGPSKSAKMGKSQGHKSLEVNDKSLGEKGNSLGVIDSRTCSRETSVCEEAVEPVEQNPTYTSIDTGNSRTGEVIPLLNKADSDPQSCDSVTRTGDPGHDATAAEEANERTSLMAVNVKDTQPDPGEKIQVIKADIHAESDSDKPASHVFRPPGSGLGKQLRTGKNSVDSSPPDKTGQKTIKPAGKNSAVSPSGKSEDKVHFIEVDKNKSPTGNKMNFETLPMKSLLKKEMLPSGKTSEKVTFPTNRTLENVAKPMKGNTVSGALPANSTCVMGKSSPSNGSVGKVNSPPVKGSTYQRISTDLAPAPETIRANKPVGPVSDTALKSKPVPKPAILSKSAVYSGPGSAPKQNGGRSENGHSLATTCVRPLPGTGQDGGGNTEEGKSTAMVNIDLNNPCVVIEQDSLDSDSDLPDSPDGSMTKLPLTDSREHLAEIITTV
ncbi:thrombospondin type-1 domain-containing protein 7B-like [Liolophura sinensis]|uniref:thrombospondin type-1 domain-containing protein 7B-like n=1 Tax=Liolophura sinensis TaxID=3198878 RepID=UPI0031587E7C